MEGGLLGVFAHPDDEAYSLAGSLARYTDEGISGTILCFTRGEAGMISAGSDAARESLGAVREAELRTACALVGVTDVRIVGTPDGGTSSTPEGVEAIVAVIREVRPRVVVTMEPEGITRHPDHIAVSAMTAGAFHRVREETQGAFPSRLYLAAVPESAMNAFTQELEARRLPPIASPDDPLAPVAAADHTIACVADVSKWMDRKAAALRAHHTQSAEMIAWMPEDLLARVLGMEAFQRPVPAWSPGDPVEDDLFAAFRRPEGGAA